MGQALGQLWLPWLIWEKKEDIKKWVKKRINRVLDSIKDLKLRTAVSAIMRGQVFGTLYLSANDKTRDYLDIASVVAASIVVGYEYLYPLVGTKLEEELDWALQQGLDPTTYGTRVGTSLLPSVTPPSVTPPSVTPPSVSGKKNGKMTVLLVLLGLLILGAKK